MKTIDLRSDTVTRPSEAMRRAMAEAEVGDDVYRDDPTVNRLESYAAELLGFEAALFTASGTQANLIGIMSHCGRGDEYIVGRLAHTYKYEAGGAAVLGSIQPQPIDFEPDATLSLTKVEKKSNPDDIHFARTACSALKTPRTAKPYPWNIYNRRRHLSEQKISACILMVPGSLMPRSNRTCRHNRLPVILIRSRSACPKASGRRSALCSAVHPALSKRQENGEKWSAAGCARPEYLPRPAYTPWKTMSTDWLLIMPTRDAEPGTAPIRSAAGDRRSGPDQYGVCYHGADTARQMAAFLQEKNILITAGRNNQTGHPSRYQPRRYHLYPGEDRPVFQPLNNSAAFQQGTHAGVPAAIAFFTTS